MTAAETAERFSHQSQEYTRYKGIKSFLKLQSTPRFLTPEQPLRRAKQLVKDLMIHYFSFGWRLRNREHFVPLYLLWKTALHLCGLLCKWLWCIWWGPKFLGSRLHKWDFCETLSRCSPFGPLWSFGTPSMASMATSTTSKHTICILTFVRFASQVTADGYSIKFQLTEKSESRIFLKIYEKEEQTSNITALPNKSPACCYPWDPPDT